MENAEIDGKSAGTGLRNVSSAMGMCTVKQARRESAIPAMMAQIRHVLFVGLKGIMKLSAIRKIMRRHLNGGEKRM